MEDHVVVGGLAAIHQFCKIGTMSMVGACSKVVQDVPPYMMADGSPARTRTINKVGLERNGVSEEAQAALKRALAAAAADGGALSEEFVLADLSEARAALEEVTGRRAPDQLLEHIFSKFCIGK
jgi:acyl-[acyl carrier protein]--UDP-N-acetylglucosamine O-acyltransferase